MCMSHLEPLGAVKTQSSKQVNQASFNQVTQQIKNDGRLQKLTTIKFSADIFPAHRFPSIKLFLKQSIALIIFLKND